MGSFKIEDAINNHLDFLEQEISSYPHYPKIMEQMSNAQKKIGYEFNNIRFLMLAFCRTINRYGNYMNDTLAQVGDAILDAIISERCFAEGKNKKETDDIRQQLGQNGNLYSITTQKSLFSFGYHEQCFHDEAPGNNQVAASKHDSFIEAIIGAIYLDGGMDEARKWIYENIMN